MPRTLRSDALDIETKILVALAFFATGSYQTIVGDSRRHCVSQSSVSKAVKQVTMALNNRNILNKFISFPFRLQEREQLKREFYSKFRMPGLMACIDGTHVAIVKPNEHEERFYNRKGYHSLNVLIICDSNLNIISVDVSYPGATHDSGVSFALPGFNLIRNDRTGKGGGGVAIYLRTDILFRVVSTSPSAYSASAEHLFIEVSFHQTKLLLGVFYSPNLFIDYFDSFDKLLDIYRPARHNNGGLQHMPSKIQLMFL
ncbi:hypothetical protein evm_007846 [Chilo suppressalis]|nr:hypothetical protein evm_007846 [Chilo suppressalis]